MKATFNYIIVFLAVSLLAISCKKDETIVQATAGTSPQLTVTQSKQVLTEAQKADTAVTFSWTKPDYGYSAAVSYAIQFAKKGTDFSGAKTVYLNNVQRKGYTVADLNAIAMELGMTAFTSGDMEVRVSGQISSEITPVYSNAATVTVTPYLSEPEYQVTYMVGDATEGGWDNSKGTPMFRDENDVFIYTFTGKFNVGSFKFIGVSGQWAPMWGSNGSGGLTVRATDSDPDPASFSVTSAGYYKVDLNLRNNTFSMTPYNEAGATVYPSIGIIGAFNGWGDIAPMTHSSLNPHFWSTQYTFGSDTELKFRIAADWSVNWGAATGKEADVRGKGAPGGGNIIVKAGTYRIIFDDITAHYVFIKQ